MRELSEHPNEAFQLVKSMKKDRKDVEGGRCIREGDGRLSFSEKDTGKVSKEHMERIMNEENERDQNVRRMSRIRMCKQNWWKGELKGLFWKKR